MKLLALVLTLVTWTPATTDINGNPLGLDESWTFVQQWLGICPGTDMVGGAGVWNGSGTTQAQFEQVPAVYYCYKVHTIVWPGEFRVSAPVQVSHQSGTCANSCHR